MNNEKQPLDPKLLLAFFGMVVGMFMAVLDIQIVASSLSVIAAGLSATSDELSWVQTAYLIAEVIIIPITGFLARLLSTRILYFIANLGFTLMSICCSFAWNIESMIVFRTLQGLFGGAMIPTVFGLIFIIFPVEKRPMITVLIGLVVTVAPTLGPTLGGYITDTASWHYMFLMNVLPGIFVCIVVFAYGYFDKPDYTLLKGFDFIGLILMICSLGSLQYILEEGGKNDWFDDTTILFTSIFTFLSFVALLIQELTYSKPLLDLSTFKNKNFAIGSTYAFITGIGLYGGVYLLPLFLFSVADFNTIQIGTTMMITGLFQFMSAPIAGRLMAKKVDLRIMLAIGFGLFGLGCYTNSFLTADSKFYDFLWPQIIRGSSLMFCFIPTNNLAIGTMKKNQVQNASGLFNLMRNLGGAFGLAVINTLIISYSKIYSQYMNENIAKTSTITQYTIKQYQHMLTTHNLNPSAPYHFINNTINRDAFILAINNIFVLISMMFFISMILIFFTSKINVKNSDESHVH